MLRFIVLVLCCWIGLWPTLAAAETPKDQAAPDFTMRLPMVLNQRQPAPAFGVQMYGSIDAPGQYASNAPEAGVAWVRWPVPWVAVEPVNTKPFNFDYSVTDASIQAAAQLHMRVIGTISDNPKWAATYANGPIDRVALAEFAQFVAALVERYDADGFQDAPNSPKVAVWELYNEPDNGSVISAEFGYPFWGDFGREYAAMLCSAYQAAKAADPGAKIALGGVAFDWFREDGGPFVHTFLDDVLRNGGGSCIDYMNFHYYPFFEAKWSAYGDALAGKANYLRGVFRQYGLGGLPLIITEAGHHSNNYPENPSTPEEQVNYLVKMSSQAAVARADILIWWSWIDLPGYWGETGLLTSTGWKKPSFDAYRVMSGKLSGAAFVREVPVSETGSAAARAYEFNAGRKLYVAWTDSANPLSIRLAGDTFMVSDALGAPRGRISDADDGAVDGFVRLMVSRQPLYLERRP